MMVTHEGAIAKTRILNEEPARDADDRRDRMLDLIEGLEDDELMHDVSPGAELQLYDDDQSANAALVAVYYSEPTMINSADGLHTMVAETLAWTDELQEVFLPFRKDCLSYLAPDVICHHRRDCRNWVTFLRSCVN